MTVELVQYFIRDNVAGLYSLKAPYGGRNYAFYLGEDDEHVWIHPIVLGIRGGETVPEVCFLSVTRLMKNDIVILDDTMLSTQITNVPFGDMKHRSLDDGPSSMVHRQYHDQVVERKSAEIARLRALLSEGV